MPTNSYVCLQTNSRSGKPPSTPLAWHPSKTSECPNIRALERPKVRTTDFSCGSSLQRLLVTRSRHWYAIRSRQLKWWPPNVRHNGCDCTFRILRHTFDNRWWRDMDDALGAKICRNRNVECQDKDIELPRRKGREIEGKEGWVLLVTNSPPPCHS